MQRQGCDCRRAGVKCLHLQTADADRGMTGKTQVIQPYRRRRLNFDYIHPVHQISHQGKDLARLLCAAKTLWRMKDARSGTEGQETRGARQPQTVRHDPYKWRAMADIRRDELA